MQRSVVRMSFLFMVLLPLFVCTFNCFSYENPGVQKFTNWSCINPDHGLRTHSEEITFTAWLKIKSQSQIYRYCRSIFCLPNRLTISDFFDLCLHWVSIVRDPDPRPSDLSILDEATQERLHDSLW